MPKRSELKISKRTVDALSVEGKDAVFWDRDLAGFGVRVYPTGRKVYVVQSRGPGGPKRKALGRHGEISADEARKQAAILIDRIKQGKDPVAELTVSGLAERFMRVHTADHWKPATAVRYRHTLDKHVLPSLGAMLLGEVEGGAVMALHHRLRDTPQAANTAVDVLSRMFTLAEAWGLAPPGNNPCHAVRRYRKRSRERFLTPEEFRRLGRVLRDSEADGSVWPVTIAAIRLLMLTGCRKERDIVSSLGRCGPYSGRVAAEGRQGGTAHGPSDGARPGGARWRSPARRGNVRVFPGPRWREPQVASSTCAGDANPDRGRDLTTCGFMI